MKIEILENNTECVKVSVQIPKRRFARDKKQHVETSHVVSHLQNEGLKFGACLREDALNNYGRDNIKLQGTWIFAAPAKKSTKKPSVKSPPTKKRNPRGSTRNTRKREENKLLGTENLE